MPTFRKKCKVNDRYVKPRRYEDLGPEIDWKFRYKLVIGLLNDAKALVEARGEDLSFVPIMAHNTPQTVRSNRPSEEPLATADFRDTLICKGPISSRHESE